MSSLWLDMMGAEVRYVGTRYRSRVLECGSGPAVVLLHGMGGHAEAYGRNVVRLGQQFRVIVPDLLWHGLSSAPEFTASSIAETIPSYVDQVVDIIDSLGIESVAVEGESLGGWVALSFALTHPARTWALVLNTASAVELGAEVRPANAGRGQGKLRTLSMAAVESPSDETVRPRLEWLMASPERVTEELLAVRLALYRRPETNQGLRRVFGLLGNQGPRPTETDLAKVDIPALVLWTDDNPGGGVEYAQAVADQLPHGRFVCIADSAHWPQWEHAEEHDRIVAAFLGEAVGGIA